MKNSDFLRFLLTSGALTFGEFLTKSGRRTPYFINTGVFHDGERISTLGQFYGECIVEQKLEGSSTIFGPAYKGIPLCVAASMSLYCTKGLKIGFTFDRKEAKEHGDKGSFVGRSINPGDRVIVVEDVITAGTTLQAIVPLLREQFKAVVSDVVIAVDRCEFGQHSSISAVQEIEQELNVKIHPLATVFDVLQFLREDVDLNIPNKKLIAENIEGYLALYGAKQ